LGGGNLHPPVFVGLNAKVEGGRIFKVISGLWLGSAHRSSGTDKIVGRAKVWRNVLGLAMKPGKVHGLLRVEGATLSTLCT
jgi:hypothetical protein